MDDVAALVRAPVPGVAIPLRVLVIEDSEDDARLALRELERGGFEPVWERVETRERTSEMLATRPWDMVLCDYMIPGFGALEALRIFKAKDLEIPFIVVSGKIGEETAVDAMRAGATDFVMKDRISRLVPVVKREIADSAARRALRQAQVEWRAVFDSVQDAIFVHDPQGRIIRGNAAYARLAGMNADALAGKPYWTVFPKAEGALPECGESASPPSAAASELRTPAGDVYLVRTFPIHGRNGTATHYIRILQDVTERNRVQEAVERSERRFRALTERSSDLVVVADAAGVVKYASPSIERLGGYAQDEVVGRNYAEFTHADDFALSTRNFAAVVGDPAALVEDEFRYRRKDGRWIWLQGISRNALADPSIGGIVINARDVTERRATEDALRRTAAELAQAQEIARMGSWTLDVASGAVGWSEQLFRMFGRDPALGPPSWPEQASLYSPESFPVLKAELDRAAASGEPFEVDVEIVDAAGKRRWATIRGRGERDASGKVAKVLGTAIDITERKHAEEALRLREARLAEAQRIAHLGSWEDDRVAGATSWSAETWRILELEPAFARASFETFVERIHPADRAAFHEAMEGSIARHAPFEKLFRLRMPDGRVKHVQGHGETLYAPDGRPASMMGTMQDVTQQVESARRLRLFRAVVDSAQDHILVVDPESLHILDASESACRSLGYSREELLRLTVRDFDMAIPARQDEFGRRLAAGESFVFESAHRRKDGSTYPVEVSIGLVVLDRAYVVSVARDITERKRAEAAMAKVNRALKTLSAGNIALVRATDEAQLLQEMTRIVAGNGAYPVCFVGFAGREPERAIEIRAASGLPVASLAELRLSWADDERGQGPTARAIRTGETQIARFSESDPRFSAWKEVPEAKGVGAFCALPLRWREGDEPFGALAIGARDADAFGPDEVALFEELAGDLAFGLASLRSHTERAKVAEQLQRSLEGMVEALAATVEMRDPYTAGHQRRVAELAVAIAREMGLPAERVQGIHFGALIHDLGKIKVPAEILAKPTRLTPTEFSLIQEHPRAGYDILKDVEFPWPVARMVLQHHERLDGSGYPDGVKADETLLESRIIAVADVVEAMSSHRPYRAGLGVDAALAQVESQRGRTLDAQAVDACLRLFHEHRFQLPASPR